MKKRRNIMYKHSMLARVAVVTDGTERTVRPEPDVSPVQAVFIANVVFCYLASFEKSISARRQYLSYRNLFICHWTYRSSI